MLDELYFLVMVLAHVDFSASEAAGRVLDHQAGDPLRE
jgi:hypothetical protein